MALKLDSSDVTEFLMEIKSGQRVVNINDIILVINIPNEEVKMGAKIVYSKLLAAHLKNGVPSKAVAKQMLKEQVKQMGLDENLLEKRDKIWTQLQKTLNEQSPDAIANAATSIDALKDLIQKTSISIMTTDNMLVLDQISDIEQLENSVMSTCAEALAAAEQDLFILQQCVLDTNGEYYWKTFEAIHAETDAALLIEVKSELVRFTQGYPSVFEMVVPKPEDFEKNESPSISS